MLSFSPGSSDTDVVFCHPGMTRELLFGDLQMRLNTLLDIYQGTGSKYGRKYINFFYACMHQIFSSYFPLSCHTSLLSKKTRCYQMMDEMREAKMSAPKVSRCACVPSDTNSFSFCLIVSSVLIFAALPSAPRPSPPITHAFSHSLRASLLSAL